MSIKLPTYMINSQITENIRVAGAARIDVAPNTYAVIANVPDVETKVTKMEAPI